MVMLMFGSLDDQQGLYGQTGFTNLFGGPLGHSAVSVLPQGSGWSVTTTVFGGDDVGFKAVVSTWTTNGQPTGQTVLPIPGSVFLQAMVPTPDGGQYLCGSLIPGQGGEHQALVAKLDAGGTLLWWRSAPEASAQQYLGITTMPDGGAVACGMADGPNGHLVILGRYTSTGDIQWTAERLFDLHAEAHALSSDDSGIMLTGRQLNFGGKTDVLFMRYDLAGNFLWNTSWGGGDDDEGRSLLPTPDGNFIMAGSTRSFGPVNAQGVRRKNLYLIKIDANGDTLWTRTFGDTVSDREAFVVRSAPNNELFVAGTIGTSGLSDALVLRIGQQGQSIWEQRYDTGKEERLLGLHALASGFAACGWSFDDPGKRALLLRRNADGN
jgi:hypothetical protein